ncbi:MAG TPA: GYF domain-containing protein [Methylovirgula sp.]|nr:GYF domain-containing protein [Methylovirgula sp.]
MSERSWYIANAGKQEGPFPEAHIRELILAGQITADTLVWSTGMSAWQRAGDIPGLMASGHAPPMPLPGGPSGPAVDLVGGAVTAEFGVWALLGRILLAAIGLLLIIPAPWAMTSYYRWFITHLRVPTIPGIGFTGWPGDIWWVFVLTGLCSYAGVPHAQHLHAHHLSILVIPVEAALSWLVIRWVLANISSEGRPLSLSFAGSVWAYIGWTLLVYLSFITIIGWAWVMTAWMRWVCRNIVDATRTVSFNASGWEVLWRTFVFGLTILFIIPIPWTLHWYVRWYVSQFSVAEKTA